MGKGQIIITGVSTGIGHAIAKAALASGFQVQGIGRRAPADLNESSGWSFVQANLTQEKEVESVPFLTNESGGPTVLINNAGTLGPVMPAGKADWNGINHAMALNVVAPMRMTARFLAEVSGERQVIFTGSGAAQFAIPGWSAYCASKSAIHMYAEVLQQEYPDVRIHAFKPGKVDTPMQAEIRATHQQDFPAVDAFKEEYEQGKLVAPETVAAKLLKVIEGPAEQPVVFALSQITL